MRKAAVRAGTKPARGWLLFLLLFGLIFLRCCYYGLVYFPQLDDYIQLHNYPVYHGAKLVILEQGLLASRPLAAVGDYFFWSGFWGNLIVASALLSALYAGSALLFRRVFSPYFGTGYVFLTVYALLPLGMEGSYWISAANRILPSLFFTALAMWLFQRWCRTGRRWALVLYGLVQLISYCFYEQGLILSVTGVLLIGILEFLERKEHRNRTLAALFTFVNAGIYFAFTGYFAAEGQLGGRMKLLLPWQEGWNETLWSALRQCEKVFLKGTWRTLAEGARRGVELLLRGENLLWVLLALGLCAILFLAARRSGAEGRRTPSALLVGFLMALAPMTIFFVLAEPTIPLRATLFSFCGLALMADSLVGLLLRGRAWRGTAVGALCTLFALASLAAAVSELHDYRQTYLEDQRAGAAVIAALDGGRGLSPAAKVAVLELEPSYLEEQSFPYREHIFGVTGSEWAFTGLLSCESGNVDFPYTTPVPTGEEWDLSGFDLVLRYDRVQGRAEPYKTIGVTE